MSEKRKPTTKIVAEFRGKRVRIELFPASLWPEKFHPRWCSRGATKRYRVRVNGKWSQGHATFTISDVMRQLRALIK